MTRAEAAVALLIFVLLTLLLSTAVDEPYQLVPLDPEVPGGTAPHLGGGEVVASGSIGGVDRVVLHEGEPTDFHGALAPSASMGRREQSPRTLID